ncbi:HNH endonuclease signature motif containing protein [Mycolicibacterium wolinskyi]|uniref:HNH endonuclease signature motif containing protein n=1 Tax=Mycolicibacterium wolinskyi TaxID=59750 RepID=UPI00391774EE
MFEELDDAALAAGIEYETRAAAASDSRRLQMIAELIGRRVAEQDDELLHWACDYWDSAAGEVAAAMNVGHRAASREMLIAVALQERFPRVAALYAQGRLSSRLISTVTWRTRLIEDAETLQIMDAALVDRVVEWGPLSVEKLEQSIDALIERHDPEALRRTRTVARDRDVCFGKPDDATGTVSLYGRLLATDRAAFENRLAHMISGVCEDDPRTLGQRRSDAMGVLGAGGDRLKCQCGKSDCPAADVVDARAANTVVYVLAEPAALDAEPDPYLSGDDESNPIPRDEPPRPAKKPASAVIIGGGVVPTPLLAQLIACGAKVRELAQPCGEPEPRYRPSTGLAAFVRMRDMTCMFPGCDRPAVNCDIDHSVPYPAGATHPSNTKCLCRTHHLLKTFWDGWSDRQLPDGTVVWTTPSGRTYTKKPASRLFFPHWDTTTAALPPPRGRTVATDRGVMMPRRALTRAQREARQIKAERALNRAYLAERNKPPPT